MVIPHKMRQQLYVHRRFAVQFLGFVVVAHGLYILINALLAQLAAHHGSHLNNILLDVPLLIGLTLIYLGTLLRRRKRTAWSVSVLAYTFYLGIQVAQLLSRVHLNDSDRYEFIGAIFLPLAVLILLKIFQKEFVVKSDIEGFGFAARFSAIILSVTLAYGISGFVLLDRADFHEEITPLSAAHYTVDQLNVTTSHQLRTYTRRSQLFVDSLSFVSTGALLYVGLSLFKPLRVRLSDHAKERQQLKNLLERYGGPSEEFFKLWPRDKHYFFDSQGQSGLAFHVSRGVALCLGDPIGRAASRSQLMREFQDYCFGNDWLPAMVYVQTSQRQLYQRQGFALQKLGEEAIVNVSRFQAETLKSKYFRQINNKFKRLDYHCELLTPPHSSEVLLELAAISDSWLNQAGRVERGFVMGYYSPEYMQMCKVLVARDDRGTIQAFLNLVPAEFNSREATYDLLRYNASSPGNINDFLLLSLIDHLASAKYEQLNLGLCPLTGLDKSAEAPNQLVDRFLRFAYANGDHFYSFNGLYRFKSKYKPEWRDRYLAYQGGVRGFTRTVGALMRAMRR